MRQLFEVTLKLKEGPIESTTFPLDQIIEGKITIRPLQRIQAAYVGYHLIAVAKKEAEISLGRRHPINPVEQIIWTKSLAENCPLSEYEPYRYNISFINNEIETYKGINTNFSLLLQVFIKIPVEAERAKVAFLEQWNPETTILKDGLYKESFFLTFKMNTYDYQLIAKQKHLTVDFENLLLFGFVIALFCLVFLASATKTLLVPSILAFIIVLVAWFYYYRYTQLGDFTIDYEQVDNKVFLFKINCDNWRFVKEVFVNYEIREKAIFQSSDYAETSIELLHASPKQIFKNQSSTLIVTNEFPEDKLGTTTVGTSTIYWVAIVEIHTVWGFHLPFEHQFVVKKKIKNINS